MKINLLLFLFFTFSAFSQSVVGKWKTIDDETGQAKSIVEIFEKSGKIYGKVHEIFDEKHKNDICKECTGEDKNKLIQGMTILKGLVKDGAEYSNGKIIDPKNGKTYKCTISLENKDKLKVRGYIGFALIGRSQYWIRVKSSLSPKAND
ncbi:MAG: DUF2147 domain-containing protein [Flavobacterium sp.]|nr:DUF2147 domain-containing protein [Flavobacterium sp.]